MGVSLGVGLTNKCNLRCAHCYRPDPSKVCDLAFEDLAKACDALDVDAVNLGTGENGLHPQFEQILDHLFDRGLLVSLTSNGLTLTQMPAEQVRWLHDVEVSIDFPDERRFDQFRGAGAWRTAHDALARCKSLDVPVTVLAVLMRDNHRDLPALAELAAEYDAPLRINAYQPVHSRQFMPTYGEFWRAIRHILGHAELLGCTEPVVRAAAGLAPEQLKCGRTSLRITPTGELLPCVYWPTSVGRVEDLERGKASVLGDDHGHGHVPAACKPCPNVTTCGGGCPSRRLLATGSLDLPDPYCPLIGGMDLSWWVTPGTPPERLRLGSVCTTLVRA